MHAYERYEAVREKAAASDKELQDQLGEQGETSANFDDVKKRRQRLFQVIHYQLCQFVFVDLVITGLFRTCQQSAGRYLQRSDEK
jgi:hypothetical protein